MEDCVGCLDVVLKREGGRGVSVSHDLSLIFDSWKPTNKFVYKVRISPSTPFMIVDMSHGVFAICMI